MDHGSKVYSPGYTVVWVHNNLETSLPGNIIAWKFHCLETSLETSSLGNTVVWTHHRNRVLIHSWILSISFLSKTHNYLFENENLRIIFNEWSMVPRSIKSQNIPVILPRAVQSIGQNLIPSTIIQWLSKVDILSEMAHNLHRELFMSESSRNWLRHSQLSWTGPRTRSISRILEGPMYVLLASECEYLAEKTAGEPVGTERNLCSEPNFGIRIHFQIFGTLGQIVLLKPVQKWYSRKFYELWSKLTQCIQVFRT